MAERKETKRLLQAFGITDTRAQMRRLIEYRNRKVKRQIAKCRAASIDAVNQLFGAKK